MKTMRAFLVGLALSGAAWPLVGKAADPKPGDSRAEVIAILGEPKGILGIGRNEELTYARGTVTLVDGVVTRTKLIAPQDWETREQNRIAREKYEAQTRLQAAADKASRIKIAEEALAHLLVDPRWKELGGEGRLDTLDRFQKAYPDADLKDLRAEVLRRRDLEQEERRRITELEARLEAAELRAQTAENRANRAESHAEAARIAANKAAESAARARRNDDFYGVRAYHEIGGGRINGAYPHPGASTVTLSNGNVVITTNGVPPGAHPRPIVIHQQPPPKPAR